MSLHGFSRGFSLVEISVTLVVAAILVTGAVSLAPLLRDTRLGTASSALRSGIALARSEAIRRHATVLLRARNDRRPPVDWKQGWESVVDENGNGAADPGETVLHRHDRLERGLTLRYGTHARYGSVRLKPDGTVWPNASFILCADGDPPAGRLIILNATGRPRSAKLSGGEAAARCGGQ